MSVDPIGIMLLDGRCHPENKGAWLKTSEVREAQEYIRQLRYRLASSQRQLALKTEQLRVATDAIQKRQWDSMHKYETCMCDLCRALVEIQRLEKEQ